MESFLAHNWVDIIFVFILLIFAVTSRGLLATSLEILSFVFSLFFSYRYYALFGSLLTQYFKTPKGIADAAGFFLAWSVFEFILYLIIYLLSRIFLQHIHLNPWNRKLGFLVGIIQGALMYLFLLSLIFSLPVRGTIKQSILDSKSGPFFVNISQSLQLKSKSIFGEAVSEALNFLTIKPHSDESISLDFKLSADKTKVDTDSENKMIELVNQERLKVGLKRLEPDINLTRLARSYGTTMFEYGFFSHISKVDGSSPGDRAEKAGIVYMVLGENLAFAPDVYLAHQGLMNSPGHRANILGADYGKVGIGVIDGGVYGRMFVQEFSN